MAKQDKNFDPTAGYRPTPKGPQFLLIVIGALVVLLLIFIGVVLLLKKDARKMQPHNPDPTPNSRLVMPAKGTMLEG